MDSLEYQQIYETYFVDVYKYVLSICKNSDLAEEITQETFFKALKSIDEFRGTCKIFSWLCQIAKNTLYNHYKRQSKFISINDDHDYEDFSTDIENTYFDSEQAKNLHRLLHDLKEPYKEVFSLRVFAELPFKQIGELFGKSDSWARVIFYRAKNKIKEELK